MKQLNIRTVHVPNAVCAVIY